MDVTNSRKNRDNGEPLLSQEEINAILEEDNTNEKIIKRIYQIGSPKEGVKRLFDFKRLKKVIIISIIAVILLLILSGTISITDILGHFIDIFNNSPNE